MASSIASTSPSGFFLFFFIINFPVFCSSCGGGAVTRVHAMEHNFNVVSAFLVLAACAFFFRLFHFCKNENIN